MDQTVPTWGYQPDGSADIFDLRPGEHLPEGWHASPDCITDPALATADALSARAEGRTYAPPAVDGVSGFRLDDAAELPADLDVGLLAEIERLKAVIATGTEENARLVSEIEQAEQDLDLAAKDIVALRESLEKAQADGGFAVTERDEALAAIDKLTSELAQTKADLDAATAPKAPAKTGK